MEINRYLVAGLAEKLRYPYVHILFGARQTGRTTLLLDLLDPDLSYNLSDPTVRFI